MLLLRRAASGLSQPLIDDPAQPIAAVSLRKTGPEAISEVQTGGKASVVVGSDEIAGWGVWKADGCSGERRDERQISPGEIPGHLSKRETGLKRRGEGPACPRRG